MALSITSITPNYGPTAGNTSITIEGTDFHSDRVVMLLHCNGTDGSTTFTDDSGYGNSPTAGGNAHIETDDSKYGGASAYFDGNGDYLSLASPFSALGVFNGDFTIECWIKWKSLPPGTSGEGARHIVGQQNYPEPGGSTWWWFVGLSNSLTLDAVINGTMQTIYAPFTWSTDVWYHIAATRSGQVGRIFIDGVLKGTNNAFTNSIIVNDARSLTIGADNGGDANMCHAYLDDIRITKGFAAYTSTFSIPTEELKAQVARVTIDGNNCINVVVQSDTEITANTPPGTVGAKDVVLLT